MLNFVLENWGTIAVALVLAATVALVLFRLIRNHRQGRSSCGCGCSSCPMNGKCHTQ
ncbi:MAG: FeoB-associated Cys-rich membrane protein [Oscillospiraceae bacterium]|nr:FeoB-associated Cys-rich membrane protein [Oscillospiraceae bacterium]